MIAIKGTNKEMRCRNFQYELGKTYKMDEEPKVCKRGFHACLNPYNVLEYYSNMDGNRFFLVELGGNITNCDSSDTKVASNEITFIREVTVDDFPVLFEEFIKDKERLANLYYSDGFAWVRLGDKSNYINTEGELLSGQWFDYCGNFSEGFACVKLDGKWNFINTKGELLSDQWFDYCDDFSEGFGCVKLNGKWNFIKPNGELLFKQWADWCSLFKNGFAHIEIDGMDYTINTKGEIID